MSNLHKIPIRIANVLIEMSSPLSAAELGIEARLGPFFATGTSPSSLASVVLRWEESLYPPEPRGEMIYDPGSIWQVYREGPDHYAVMSYPSENGEAQVQGVLRANSTWDDLTLAEHRNRASWQSLLNIGAGELILRTAILLTGGLVFHSSGLDDNGKGIVFIGHSGAGKSTQLGLWNQEPGVVCLNDDRTAVQVESHGPMCYGTPWGGSSDIACNHAAPLAALIVLEQASANTIGVLPPATAAGLLMARAFLPYWDPMLMRRAMDNLNTIVTQVPIYRLRCRPEAAVIPLVRSVLDSRPERSHRQVPMETYETSASTLNTGESVPVRHMVS